MEIPLEVCPSFLLKHPKKENVIIVGDFSGGIRVFNIDFNEWKFKQKFYCPPNSKYHNT